jgi:ABC-type polysaccharide/polyol phosphate export permease
MIEMVYMTLTLMAGIIVVMFVATAISSIINSMRENEASRDAVSRRVAF